MEKVIGSIPVTGTILNNYNNIYDIMDRIFLLLLLLMAFLVGCTPKENATTEDIRERKTPSATSSFTSDELFKAIEQWVREDIENRRITTAKTTGSMLPTIDSRSLIVVERVTENTILYTGDIVGTKQQILHRIHSIAGNSYVLSGDSNDFLDNPVHRRDIEWRVVSIFYTNKRHQNNL